MYLIFVLFRRTRGGRKLWESRDDSKWGHDKFEEMTSQERHYDVVNFSYMSYLHKCCNSFSFFSSVLRSQPSDIYMDSGEEVF